ncbi:Cof-type HAD-IIB family hydrolase [Streptococcus halichoeri]|uniref:Cof-type HAD-IIB family hydrolase n=1 Tax=Streptococcus halichoeri TaxID=254785 RepID=UPI001C8D8F7C|nr:Cof-type HAD-IIB family hydrolase [Streptococcus halichoeri]
MKPIKLLALDLDGTLLTTDKRVTQANQKAIRQAQAAGVQVVITTGRPLKAIEGLLTELVLTGPEHYSITFNGGLVQRNSGEILAKSSLTFDQVRDIHQTLYHLNIPTDILSEGRVYSIAGQDGCQSQYHLANPALAFVTCDSLDDLDPNIIYNKVVSVTDADYLDQQLAHLPGAIYDHYEAFKSRDIIFEIMPKGIHKAFGLALLCEHLGLLPENVMAMGDEANDYTMLKWAGLGVAMANAVPSIKAVADQVTQHSNDASGVAEAIETYILAKEI